MGSLLDEPATILVVLTLAAFLLVVEAALPTVGIAGTLALVLSAAAVIGIERQDATWWPLLGPALAVVLWSVMVARRSRPPGLQVAAAVVFGAGSIAFGVMADSPFTAVIGAAGAVKMAILFPWVHGATRRLLERPTQVGMDSLVGATAEVVAWSDSAGTVRLQGSLWSARSNQPLDIGDLVTVVAFAGTTLDVAPPTDHNVKEPTWKQ
ncbi:MAG: NfeD family protein [Acidimicrobiales bacterium]